LSELPDVGHYVFGVFDAPFVALVPAESALTDFAPLPDLLWVFAEPGQVMWLAEAAPVSCSVISHLGIVIL